jgi:ssDNA-binding replication factor A large subunit
MVREANRSLTVVETIVEDILSKRRELSQDQVLALIEEKKREGRGLLSDEGAARLVAEELLIQTRGTELGRMRMKDLVPGLNDVTISGRILLTWPPQDFQRKDGTPGRVMRIILADKSGKVRSAIWDRHVDVLSRAGELQGRVLRIGHAYTRQGLAGDAEVHAGDRSNIEIDPEDMPKSDLPEFGELFTPLAKLVGGANQINAIGIVQSEPRRYTFAKEERTGSVLRAFIADESGSMPLVAWNERAEELRDLKSGVIVQVLNARVRLDRNGVPELHVESRSQVQMLETAPPYLKLPVTKACKIAEVGPMGSVNLTVSVFAVGDLQEIKRPSGEATKVTRLLVSDETGIVSLSLWDDKADIATSLHEGDTVEITGASARERQGEIMLSLGRSGELRKSPAKLASAKKVTKLNALQQSKGLVIVEGNVADTPVARQVVTERGENIDLVSLTLRDDTAACRVTFWRSQTAGAVKLRPGVRVRIHGMKVRTGLSGDFELSSIPLSRLEILEENEKDRPAWEDIRHVIALEPGLKTWVKGVILELLDDPKASFLCEACGSELRFAEGQLRCENCNLPRSGRLALSTQLRLDDGTGVVVVKLMRADASKLSIFDRQIMEGQMLKSNVPEFELGEEQRLNLTGKEVELHGTAKPSPEHGRLEFIADKVMPASSS